MVHGSFWRMMKTPYYKKGCRTAKTLKKLPWDHIGSAANFHRNLQKLLQKKVMFIGGL